MIQTLAGRTLKNSSKFNLKSRPIFCQGSKPAKYNIRLAYPPDYDKTFNFMVYNFIKSEPSIVNAGGGVADCPDPVILKLMRDHISSGMTLICEDFNTKCIAGVSVNLHSRYSGIEELMEMSKCCQNPTARDLLRFDAYVSREADPWNKCSVESLFECACVAVSPEHTRQGVAQRLVEDSWILARDLDYRLFRIDASNIYTGYIAKSYGWNCFWSIPYRRYCNEEGQPVFTNIKEPHTCFDMYLDNLSDVSRYRPKRTKKS